MTRTRSTVVLAVLWIALSFAAAVAQVAGPSQMDQCDQETFTITLENTSPTQSACDIVIAATPPATGFSYVSGTGAVTLHDLPDPIAADPTANAWDIGAIVGGDYELPPGEQISIAFDLAADCTAESGNIEVQIDYADCTTAQPYQELDSLSIEVLPGALIISKTPSVQNASVGDQVTWTITVASSGLGMIRNVEVADVLGDGLAYVSDTGGGSNAGQTTTWDLGDIAAGDSVSFDLTAEVIGCADLVNTADASWGCGPAEICYDTQNPGPCGCPSATASLNLLVDNPALSFTPPNVTVAYCTDETAGLIQITNSGAGAARNIELCCDIAHLQVDPTRLPPGTTYSGGCFQVPDIAAGTAFDLTFYVLHSDVDWCAGGPSGQNTFQLTYTNDCGIPFVAYPQFSTLSAEAGPSLDVTKTGPASLRLGETGSYDITVAYVGDLACGAGSSGTVTVVDSYPTGFSVVDPDGGTVDGGARTITWTWTPDPGTPFTRTVRLEAPADCAYCAQPGGGSDPNTVTATAVDCCGCTITGSAQVPTTILCEGYGDATDYFSSSMSLDRTTTVRCSGDYAVTVTHTYTFIDDPALDDFLLNEFTYFVNGGGDLQYATGTASVTGATLGTVVDNTPAGQLELPLTDATTVRGKTIEYTYTLTVLGLDDPSCQATSYPIYAGIEVDPGATSIGTCGTMYADPPAPYAVAQPPAMSVSIDGIPTIQEYCATYDVTITLTKTSNLADPHDVRLVLTNVGGSLIDLSGALCSGVVPTDGTSCAAPIEGANTYEWRFADGFVAGDTATIGPIRVTVPCAGPLADLSVVATFDDLCHDDATYGDACSTAASDAASLSLSADVYTRKSPEVLFATERNVTWSLVVHNTGNGTAYNVWVDDILGGGLIFDPGNTNSAGAAVTANQDHLGNPINGASFLFDEVAPGELRTITFAAELVGCSDLTNDIEVSWGCGGGDCQTPRTDSSSVLTPSVNMVSTSYAPTPLDVCTTSTATVTAKNAGIGTVYNVSAHATLPNGLEYITGTAEYRTYVFGDTPGSWNPTADPSGVPGPDLVWTSTEIADLESVAPDVVIEIRYGVTIGCDFPGGNLQFQTSYENPCGDTFDSNVGSFSLSARIPDVSVSVVQDPDDAIPCGASATWTITVQNDGPVPAPYIRVVSTLDAGWTYVSSTGGADNVGQVTTWVIADLGAGASTDLTITADSTSAGGGNCDDLNHQVQAFWACDETDVQCLSSAADTASIVGARTPPVTVGATLVPDSVEACTDTTTFTLTVTNGSATAPASYIDARVTLPVGLSYVLATTEIDCGSGFVSSPDPNTDGQQLTWYDTEAEGGPNDACATLAASGQIRIRFDVDSSCYFNAASANSRIFYYDCCGVTQAQQSRNDTIGSDQPNLTITKTPDITDAVCGDTVTWTIQVTNTSANAIAEVVRIEDFLGANLSYVSATGGAAAISGGQILTPTPPAHGAAYGWELGPLAPLASTSVTISAQLVAPADCGNALRTNTATVTWACGVPDGDPTTADYDCQSNEWDSASNRVPMPNLQIDSSDIAPMFACTGDGIAPGSGEIEIVVRNTGDGPIPLGFDFTIAVTETTTGYSVTDTFTNLGGTLPLAPGGSETLVFPWAVTCASCAYTVNVTLDTLGDICECDETDNATTRNETITLPDLVVDSAGLSVTCADDGRIRIQGPVTLRNDGCGDPLAGTVRVRFRLYDAADCAGNQVDTFAMDLTGLSIVANGGTQERTIDVTRTLDACDTCVLSVRIEVDDGDSICECDGTNNALCAGTFPIDFPDLTVTDIDFSQVTCASDGIAGTVRVTVLNDGCGAAGPFDLRLETDGCLAFSDEPVVGLAASASTTVDFAIAGPWPDCADCSCTFTATVDPSNAICECDGTNNARSEPIASILPDLEISGAIASIGCSVDGQATLDADVTVLNAGCADVTGSYDLRVTIYQDVNCAGAVVDTWTEAVSDDVAASGSAAISLTTHVLSQGLCANDCAYSARFEVDASDDICECDGADNAFCLTSIPSELPDLVVTEVDPSVDCRAGTASVTATVENVGCGDASSVVFRLTSAGCALSIDSAPIDLASGASQDVVFAYTPDCAPGSWNCTYTVAADPDGSICECSGANTLTRDPYPGIGSIGDRVWFDIDGDGVQDGGEDGIPNVTLVLEGDLDGDRSIDYVAETTTDADGEYLFDALPAGLYTITVDDGTLPDGLAQTYDFDGLGTPHTSDYALAENEHHREQDFGYRGTGSIGDRVWFDIDGDGVQDPSEPGIENVTVTLEGDVDADGVVEILTTTTDADGLYLFEFLPAGPYTITADDATLPGGLAQTYDADGLGSAHTSSYTLGVGEHDREQDFGYATPALSVDKVISEIRRAGSSIGNIVGPVEPGDLVVYEFEIENVGPVPAYDVGFDDTLPPGVEIAAGVPGSYVVTALAASGSLGLAGGETSFTASLGVQVDAGETLTATFTAVVTSAVSQGDSLTNTAHAFGDREDGTPIPAENAELGDTSDADAEDPDADDTGIVTVSVLRPALSVDKTIVDIDRPGVGSLGIAGPVEPGDVVFYRFVIRNVGGGTAYCVEFVDALPNGLVTETDPPGGAGTYAVSGGGASGSLGLADGAASFATAIDAEIAAGEALTAEFAAEVTSGIVQGVDLVNTAEATGEDGFGAQIPDENPDAGDTADDDAEDPDADDTGIAVLPAEEPALSVDKVIVDIVRRGSSIGSTAGPVEPGDVILYRYTIRNVGLGTAYAVDFADTLPTGLVTETDAPGGAGTYAVTAPAASGSLGLADGLGAFATSIGATIEGGGQLVAEYAVLVTSDVRQGIDLINVAASAGVDGAGNAIPGANADLGDTSDDDGEDPDADDTGISIVAPVVPALTIDKRVVDVLRGGASVGVVDPLLYGDVIVYRVTVRNVGLGTAYDVDFDDALPTGLVIESDAPGHAGTYAVTDPASSGGLGLPDNVGAFATSIGTTIAGGGTLTVFYTVLVTPTAPPSIDLINVAATAGVDGAGTPIPQENDDVGDTSDDDEEDPDADDAGIAVVRVGIPALVTRKAVASIVRRGVEVDGDRIEPGDVVTYEVGVANVGDAPAEDVDLQDDLPAELAYAGNTSATWSGGSSTIDPTGAPGPTPTWPLGATIEVDDELVLRFDALVIGPIGQDAVYVNTITATGVDASGAPIRLDASDLVPEDDDPDDASDVSLVGAVPALVTDKAVADVVRDGRSLGPVETIERHDVIVYELRIGNVGLGTAYDVDVLDALPSPFAYREGSTVATWPLRIGEYARNPSGAPGSTLLWNTDAVLAPGEALSLSFAAIVHGPVSAGEAYTNILTATGEDGGRDPIPADRSHDVPDDVDLDDRDDVSLVAAADVPALVTTKRVVSIERDGVLVLDPRVEVGDVVRFELTVENVGSATAIDIDVFDRLPLEFVYVTGSTSADWRSGSSFVDPASGVGLSWNLGATLRPDDRLRLTFDAQLIGPVFDGLIYRNRMNATGRGPDGVPIPTDQRAVVPADDDPDDASEAILLGRSSFVQGEGGGLIPVPILRKTAEVLGEGACEGAVAEVERLWFQTDIAMYAAAEFGRLDGLDEDLMRAPETLLPTWLRTVQAETDLYAMDNLLQVDVLAPLGQRLVDGPRIVGLADRAGTSPETALRARLDELASRAGLSPETAADLPPIENWILLEHAGGEPIVPQTLDGPLGPGGRWTIVDERIVASAIGMGLLEQVTAARDLLEKGASLDSASDGSLDRFVGWTLVEAMLNKVLAVDLWLTSRRSGEAAYVPHAHVVRSDDGDDRFLVDDASTHLFDGLSLIWGLARFAAFIDEVEAAWPADEADSRALARDTTHRLLAEAVDAIDRKHLTSDGRWLAIDDDEATATASTVDLGLLLAALVEAHDVVEQSTKAIVVRLADLAMRELEARQTSDGRFAVSDEAPSQTSWALAPQLAGIRGLLAVHALIHDEEALDGARRAFEALDQGLWVSDAAEGLYASYRVGNAVAFCHTPLEAGLVVGALCELAEAWPENADLVIRRVADHTRSLLDHAALQLSNARPAIGNVTFGDGRGSIASIARPLDARTLAPVLQQRLCLVDAPGDGPCAGWNALPDDAWYRTDVSMLAGFVVQERLPEIEDFADANLAAVVIHSGLGVRFDNVPSLAEAVSDFATQAGIDASIVRPNPVAIPFAGGDPLLPSSESLVWNPGGFDRRIVSSAVGMTLAREAQEARQLIAVDEGDPSRTFKGLILGASILEMLDALDAMRADGPSETAYLPSISEPSPDGVGWRTVDPTSRLIDQLALLWGLSEAHTLLSDPASARLLDRQPAIERRTAREWVDLARDLAETVLSTLEITHLDPENAVLVDEVRPIGDAWLRGDRVTTSTLGLTAAALERTIDAFGPSSDLARRALDLLSAEIAFLRETLPDARGGHVEAWIRNEDPQAAGCEPRTLAGQLGGLLGLLAAEAELALDPSVVLDAFRAFDARFWDSTMQLYRSALERLEWCVTPLDLALAVETLARVRALADPSEADRIDRRLSRHVDRVLDGVRLQLSSEHPRLLIGGGSADVDYAPVFDERVCLRPIEVVTGAALGRPGDTVRYTVTAENATEASFFDLVLVDVLPDGVTPIAVEPDAEIVGQTLRWTFDELPPGDQRTWQIVARIDETVAPDLGTLDNCAELTYVDSTGAPGPPREACAAVSIGAPDGDLGSLWNADVDYVTDQAMFLSVALEELAVEQDARWSRSESAREMSLANLGALLGGSNLGVPLRFAPSFALPALAASASRDSALEITLDAFALEAGLPRAPDIVHPILVPFERGTPLLDGEGFVERDEHVTPAALGWTLAREALFIDAPDPADDPLSESLRRIVSFLVSEQLDWLAAAVEWVADFDGADGVYLADAIRPSVVGDEIAYVVVDPSSTAYGQAALLYGLLIAADVDGIGARTSRLALQLAEDTFDRLAAHWDDEANRLIDVLDPAEDVEPTEADWIDAAVVAKALADAVGRLPNRRTEAEGLLARLAVRASTEGPLERGLEAEEAGRLAALLFEAEVTDDATLRATATAGWDALSSRVRNPDAGALILSRRVRAGWTHTPRELAAMIDLAAQLVRAVPEIRDEVLAAAAVLVDQGIVADRVQLVDPSRLWCVHTAVPCVGPAPVFATHRGSLPAVWDAWLPGAP